MTVTHDEIPHHKLLYAYEIKMRKPENRRSYRYILHRFLSTEERGYWLREGNMKPLNSPILLNKRRNKVLYRHPMLQAARSCHYWPVTLVEDSCGVYRLYIKLTGRPTDPAILKAAQGKRLEH